MLRLDRTHPFADGHGFFGHGLGVRHVVLHDRLEKLVFILPVKRRLEEENKGEAKLLKKHPFSGYLVGSSRKRPHLSGQHLVEQDPISPPVH